MMFVTTRTPILREGHPVSFSHSAGSPSSLNARAAGNAGTEDADISSLLRMLASVTDPRSPQGIQHALGFMLAVCVVAMLAGAGNYREIAGHAADIPQPLLKKLGAEWCWFRLRCKYPSESTIRNVLTRIDAAELDKITGKWLSAHARKDGEGEWVIALDGKVLRGAWTGENDKVTLFSAMLHREAVTIAQVRVPDGTNEITQAGTLLDTAGIPGGEPALVTLDAAHTQRETAETIGGKPGWDYLMTVEHASHCSCCWSWRVKESSLAVSGLDTEPFAASAGEVDGVEFAALDLVQHGLAGDAEAGGGLAEGQPAVGGLGLDPVAELLVDADLPGCSRGELLAGDEAVAQPPVDGGAGDAELACGFGDADHGRILAAGCDICGGCLVFGDAVVGA